MQTAQRNVSELLTGSKTYVVPQFQRCYKWKNEQWIELFEDIHEQYESITANPDDDAEGHFIGSIILHPAPGETSTVKRSWIIDGQQRITTLMVLIAALRDERLQSDPDWNPNEYTDQYLKNPYSKNQPYRLEPGDADKSDFISTIIEGHPSGQIGKAYKWFRQAIKEQIKNSSEFSFDNFEKALLLRLIFVEIDTTPSDNIYEIFNTINYSGMKLSPVDLIRNYSLMQFANDSSNKYELLWQPLQKQFNNDEAAFSQYIWAQIVRKRPQARQNNLYAEFQLVIKKTSKDNNCDIATATEDVLSQYKEEATLYQQITTIDSEITDSWSSDLLNIVRDLALWGAKPRLPLELEILSRYHQGIIKEQDAVQSLKYLHSYIVRRALCGIPTNNLTPTLSPIPATLIDDEDVSSQLAIELSKKAWPNDEEVLQAGSTAPLYITIKKHQLIYILTTLSGQDGSRNSRSIVCRFLPEKIEEWEEYLKEKDISIETAEAKGNTLGNLTLNQTDLKPYFLEKVPWTPQGVENRSRILLRKAIELWSRPMGKDTGSLSKSSLLPTDYSVESLLAALPADKWISIPDLSKISGENREKVIQDVDKAGYAIKHIGNLEGVSGTVDDSSPLVDDARFDIEQMIQSFDRLGGNLQ